MSSFNPQDGPQFRDEETEAQKGHTAGKRKKQDLNMGSQSSQTGLQTLRPRGLLGGSIQPLSLYRSGVMRPREKGKELNNIGDQALLTEIIQSNGGKVDGGPSEP